jgi:cytochrome c peroxidase
MYDGAVSHLDLQPIIPLSEIEMKGDLNAILV